MPNLNEIAYNILNKFVGGRSTNNEYISLDQIKFNINYYRAIILHRDLDKTVLEDEAFYQTISLTLTEEEAGLYASDSQIPKIVRLSSRYAARVYTPLKDYPVHIYNNIRHDSHRRYTSGNAKSYFRDGKLYVKDVTNPTPVTLKAIFENPSQAYLFEGASPMNVDDMDYPLSLDIIQRLSENLIKGDIELMQIPPDVTHDNLPNTATGNG